MKINRRAKLAFLGFGSGLVVGTLIGVERYVTTGFPFPHIVILKGTVLGGLVAGSLSFLELVYLPDRLRPLNFLAAILVKAVAYTALVVLGFLVVTYGFISWMPWDFQKAMLVPALAISFISVLMFTFFTSLSRLLGGRVLLNFFTGRYHKPVEERRIFLLADLVSSTSIAEKIGNRDFHRFLNEFILDITEPILANHGEIYKYVGDEVIVAWHLKDRRSNYDCVACCLEMMNTVRRNRAKYVGRYGCFPEFRAGLHCGAVVTGEMGEDKKEIAFLGDVLNTAARIQEQAKVIDKTILISRPLMDEIAFPAGVTTESMGIIRLRGKENEIELFSLEPQLNS